MYQRLDSQIVPALIGTVAPDFTLPDTSSTRLSLQSLRGRSIVLVFYPLDWEPVSREQLTLYQEYTDEFARLKACVIGISVDHTWRHEAFAHDARIHFPLLADFQPRGAVARLYGVYRARLGISARALFVLDRSGVIRFSQAYPDSLDPGVHGLLTVLEAMANDDEAL